MGKRSKESSGTFALNNGTYDFFNAVVKYVLPALGTFYFTLATIWGFPYGEQIVGTLAALALVLGVILAVSKGSYTGSSKELDGSFVVNTTDPMKDHYLLDISTDLGKVANMDTITLKVKNESSQ